MSTGTPWVPCADISFIPLVESEIESKGETGFLKVYPLDNPTASLSTVIARGGLREEVGKGKRSHLWGARCERCFRAQGGLLELEWFKKTALCPETPLAPRTPKVGSDRNSTRLNSS